MAKIEELFVYNPETGELSWKPRRDKLGRLITRCRGRAGYVGRDGYIQLEIDNKPHKAHRIIWRLMTGEDAPEEIDHVNMIKTDNRWVNLRAASRSQNAANRGVRRDSKVGLKGVRRTKNGKAFTAQFAQRSLGVFDCPAAASMAFQIAQNSAFGDYGRPI